MQKSPKKNLTAHPKIGSHKQTYLLELLRFLKWRADRIQLQKEIRDMFLSHAARGRGHII